MNQKLVSIVIPVYNVRDYLEECLSSVISQTYECLEILIVDDGSTDGSSKICDRFAKEDSRVHVIHQENSGVALSRKKAILEAKGEYVCFVDGDDTIEPGMVEYFVNNIGSCDCITSGCICEKRTGELYERVDSFAEGIYEAGNKLDYIISNMISFENDLKDGLLPFLVNKMYRADIMKDVVGDIEETLAYAEDRDLLFRYVLKCNSILITYACFYYYRYRIGSAVRAANKNFMHDLNNLYLSLEKVFAGHPLEKSLMRQLQLFIMSRTTLITHFMGFYTEAQSIRHIFPFQDIPGRSRIVLYGAGVVGNNYYRQIIAQGKLDIVLWADRSWGKYKDNYIPICPPDQILSVAYDFIIVAVKESQMADQIKQALNNMGIPIEIILWREPLSIMNN